LSTTEATLHIANSDEPRSTAAKGLPDAAARHSSSEFQPEDVFFWGGGWRSRRGRAVAEALPLDRTTVMLSSGKCIQKGSLFKRVHYNGSMVLPAQAVP